MARKGIGDFPKADPTEEVTGKGIAVLLLFFVLYVVLYALSYPLGRISGNPLLSVPFASPYTLICLVLAIAGLWLIIRHFKEFKVNDFAVSFLLSALVTVVVTSILFGLPMAYLAYKKDIETAIGFHWIIDAVRFTLGV